MSKFEGGIVPAFTPPPLPSEDKRWKIVNGTMRKNGFNRHALIETLHTVQSSFGFLDDDAIPEPDQSADLVLFIFSLHHVPDAKLAGALAEVRRILRPAGRLYVAEPLPQGPHQYVMELFHDETAVRKAAAEALAHFARPRFAVDEISTYADTRRYASFDGFAEQMIANMRFNGYSKEAVLAPAVRRRFDETFATSGDKFDQPVRIDCFGPAA